MQKLSSAFRALYSGAAPAEVRAEVNGALGGIIALAETEGFSGNVWHCYIAWLLVGDENPFSHSCERRSAARGTLTELAGADFENVRALLHFDFSELENYTQQSFYPLLRDYTPAVSTPVGEAVSALAKALGECSSAEEIMQLLSERYRSDGAGEFGLYTAFRLGSGAQLIPIVSLESVTLDTLVGYEVQKAQMRENIGAFAEGRPFNNMLLYGDAGTGKSTSMKALLNEYSACGVRMVEVYKRQFELLSDLFETLAGRNYRFIIFMDDLSFEENEVGYKHLKAIMEGGVGSMPENVMLCASSNRRHLVRETWRDRNDREFDGDVHRSDTMEERLSLAERFGCQVCFSDPSRAQYHEIVLTLAERAGISMDAEALCKAADAWELRHGGVSGRTARQFINHLSAVPSED